MEERVCFVLSDATSITLGTEELQRAYHALWDICGEPGAVSMAAILLNARAEARPTGYVELRQRESDAFRSVIDRYADPS
jgi:hypothetical protein